MNTRDEKAIDSEARHSCHAVIICRRRALHPDGRPRTFPFVDTKGQKKKKKKFISLKQSNKFMEIIRRAVSAAPQFNKQQAFLLSA